MSALLKSMGEPMTMTSLELAELTEKRHDNVKRLIENLANQGVISLPQIEEVKVQRERREESVSIYRVGKRDSYIIVAQLSQEFTARLVDRWQALEAGAAPMLNMRDPKQMALAALQLIEVNQELQTTICWSRKNGPTPARWAPVCWRTPTRSSPA